MDTNCRHRTVVNRRLDPLQHVTPIMKWPKCFHDYSSFVPCSLHYNCCCISKSHLREIVNELKLQSITLIKSLFLNVDTLVTDFIYMYCVYSFPVIQDVSR